MMPSDPPVMNKYSLVRVAARRARQLQSGAPPLGDSRSIKACRVAQDEIKAGFIGFVLPQAAPVPQLDPLDHLLSGKL